MFSAPAALVLAPDVWADGAVEEGGEGVPGGGHADGDGEGPYGEGKGGGPEGGAVEGDQVVEDEGEDQVPSPVTAPTATRCLCGSKEKQLGAGRSGWGGHWLCAHDRATAEQQLIAILLSHRSCSAVLKFRSRLR